MKRLILMLCVAATIISCQRDPLADIRSGEWNKEKQLISISFTSQVGDADISISAEDITVGTAIVNIMQPDYSQPMEVKSMEISYGSTASINVGDLVSFDPISRTATLEITAQDGKVRTYTLRADEVVEDLVGTWSITGFDVWGGAATQWGCSDMIDFLNPDKGCSWDATTGPAAELDNTLTFTFGGLNEAGETYGTCVNDAGADGLYADFTWVGAPDGYTLVDGNPNFRKIPTGQSNWTRNVSLGTITFEKDGVVTTVVDFIEEPGTFTCYGVEENRDLIVRSAAMGFKEMAFQGWDDNILWTTYGRVMHWPHEFFVQIEKQ